MSRWWKCDLQVATPGARGFERPAGATWNVNTSAGRALVADEFIAATVASDVAVLVLAEHNSAEWIEPLVEAGRRAGVYVFPGIEVTTASGADGAHVIIIGGQERSASDFDALLAGACGFSDDHPPFQPNGTPAAAPRTLPQILDALPDQYLAVAPHAFSENGIASQDTIEGDLRWKALHHPRLGAIDVGDAANLANDASFRAKFIRRELDHFPCLPSLAFVSTSDAYSLSDIGRRFNWIRMSQPSIEALRQAFLDHEARIVCDWDPRYHGTVLTPNSISHAWVESLSLAGATSTAAPLEVTFDPRLNVLIGGRGAGKSTVVAALRCLYGDIQNLPAQTRAEAQRLVDDVFTEARAVGRHHLPHSGDSQAAAWTRAAGSTTERTDGTVTQTDFKVRVINQKELFERAANTLDDPHMTSRNLLTLVDDALSSTGSRGPGSPSDFAAALDEAQTAWAAAARRHQAESEAVAGRELVQERVDELTRQVAAFDDAARRARRERNDQRLGESRWLSGRDTTFAAAITGLTDDIDGRLATPEPAPPAGPTAADEEMVALHAELSRIRQGLRKGLANRLARASSELDEWRARRNRSAWSSRVRDAEEDTVAYTQELTALGLDPAAYEQVRAQLSEQRTLLESLNQRAAELTRLQDEVSAAWTTIEALLQERRDARSTLLLDVAQRSGMLRFTLKSAADETAWTKRIRELLNLRADGFLEEVPSLARWLWTETVDTERGQRLATWRSACVSGDFDALAEHARLRQAWAARLRNLDPLVRARIAAEVPEDTVSMRFLREGGDPSRDQDWQLLTAGSPGQRSAAMLSFVLHYGNDPLVLDQPEDDLDTEWISQLVVRQLRTSRWTRQLIVVTHNANIPVNADAERTIVLENSGAGISVRTSPPVGVGADAREHCGPLEDALVRADIQQIMEGGIDAFVRRERRYNNELNTYRAALQKARTPAGAGDQ